MIKSLATALLLVTLLSAACSAHHEAAARPPIIMITVDTLRSDHLPAYGYRGVETPNIDSLVAQSTLFTHAYSHCPLTLPSHLSLLTGLLPSQHGVRDNLGYAFDAKQPTVARLLHDHGYATGAAVSAYVLRRNSGIASGFDDYDDGIPVVDGAPLANLQRNGNETEQIAEGWIEHHSDHPFFYWIHLYEPHAPYQPQAPFDAKYSNKYDGEIAATDAIIGKLLQFLRRKNLYDRAVIVLASDHGEGLMDHGEQEHGVFLYREALQVPLLIKHAGQSAATRDEADAGLIDVAPTLLSEAGVTAPPAMAGTTLVANRAPRELYAESNYARLHFGWSGLRSEIGGGHHFIEAPKSELYDLRHDPSEKNNLYLTDRRTSAALRRALPEEITAAPASVSAEEKARLASLGYISASAAGNGPLADPKDHINDLTQVQQIADHLRGGDRNGAIAAIVALLKTNPGWSDLRDQLGILYEESGELAKAEENYREAIRATPQLAPQFALSLANILLAEKKYDQAAAHASLATTTSPAEAHQMLGLIALARNDLATARKEAEAARAFPSQEIEADFLLGQIDRASHSLDAALSDFQRVQTAATLHGVPLPSRFHFLYGDTLASKGDVSSAIGMMEQQIVRDPHDREAYASLALLYLIDHRHDRATATMERLMSNNPDAKTRQFAEESMKKWGGV